MRKQLKQIYDKSEGILNTGHSYLFIYDIEKKKFREVALPEADWKDCPIMMMHLIELEEIIALKDKENKPFSLGDFDGKYFVVWGETLFEFEDRILEYRKRKEGSESLPVAGSIPSWELLNRKQKEIIENLVKEFITLNSK